MAIYCGVPACELIAQSEVGPFCAWHFEHAASANLAVLMHVILRDMVHVFDHPDSTVTHVRQSHTQAVGQARALLARIGG